MIALGLILALQVTASVPVPPVAPVTIAAPSASALALAHDIAALQNSDDVARIQVDKLVADMPKALLANSDLASMETEHPGIVAYIVAAARPTLDRQLKRQGPALIDRLAAVYASSLNENELQQALAFYHSPTGTWLIDKIAHGVDLSAIMTKAVASPDAPVAGSDFGNAIAHAAPSLVAEMTAPRVSAIMAFLGSNAGKKISALRPRLLETAAAFTNEPDPVGEKEMEDTMVAAVKEFIAKHDRVPTRQKATS